MFGKRLRPRYGLLFIVAASLTTFLAGCSPEQDYPRIDLNERAEIRLSADAGVSAAPFRVGIAGVISPKATLQTYERLMSYIGEELRQPVEIVQRQTYAEMNELIRDRYVDVAFVCSLAYVLGREEFGMELLAVPVSGGETVYYSYVIVARDSDIQRFEDLRGKTFAFTDPISNSGRLAPVYWLWAQGETPETFFKKTIFTYSHDNSIEAVVDGVVDGAAVDSLVYDSLVASEPEVGEKTRIIRVSQPFGIPPVVVHPDLDTEVKARLRGLFLNLHKAEQGQHLLDQLGISRFVLGEDSSYDSIRAMYAALGW